MDSSWEIIIFTIWFVWIFSLVTTRVCSPILYIFARWARWISISITSTYALKSLGVLNHPYWAIFIISFLGLFLIESIYYWIYIAAISRSDYKLFPNYEENKEGDEWPAQKKFIQLREQIREKKFIKQISLKTNLIEGEKPLRSTLFLSADQKTQLQVIFIPNVKENLYATYSIKTQLEDGTYIITDNFYLPYAGFFPESWNIERKPWTRRFSKLLERHNKRVKNASKASIICHIDPMTELNEQNSRLKKLNIELGFLVPYEEQELYGQITREGRYLIWKENWLLNYLGIPAKYN